MPDTTNTNTSVSMPIRITVAALVSLTLAVFVLVWEGGIIHNGSQPPWYGTIMILPILSFLLTLGSNCLIQQLSCKKVEWLTQVYRSVVAPLSLYVMLSVLYFIPGLRWPIEGLAQKAGPDMRKGLSSGFYTFWISMYSSGILNSMAQMC